MAILILNARACFTRKSSLKNFSRKTWTDKRISPSLTFKIWLEPTHEGRATIIRFAQDKCKVIKILRLHGRGGLEETDLLLRKLRSQYAETILITQELSENLQNSRSEARRNQIPYQNVRSSPNIEEDNQQSGDPVVPARESQILNLQAPRNTPSLSRQFSDIATDKPFDNAPSYYSSTSTCGHVNDFNNFLSFFFIIKCPPKQFNNIFLCYFVPKPSC